MSQSYFYYYYYKNKGKMVKFCLWKIQNLEIIYEYILLQILMHYIQNEQYE